MTKKMITISKFYIQKLFIILTTRFLNNFNLSSWIHYSLSMFQLKGDIMSWTHHSVQFDQHRGEQVCNHAYYA